MTRSDLIAALHARFPHLRQAHLATVVEGILEEITATLANGGRVELRNFGSFSVRTRVAYEGRNPKTGEALNIPARVTPAFQAGKQLREMLNS